LAFFCLAKAIVRGVERRSERVLDFCQLSMRFAILASLVLFFRWICTIAEPLHSQSKPNILLITLDTTRADRMGFLGSKRGLTPSLDELARQSIVFTRTYAQVPLTTPSHAALLTGTYPRFNGVEVLRDPLRRDLPFIPDILQQSGYRTAAFVGSMILDPSSGAPGFERGFDVYDAGFHLAGPGEDRYHSVERRAEVTANRALQWLGHNEQQPFFLWLHFYDPHDPYDPPPPFRQRYANAPYDGEIAYTDSVVGVVMEKLKALGLFENCLIVIAADHGEAFGEHGERRHGLLLYDETIHVPFVLKLPREQDGGSVVTNRVALADVAPTMLESVDVPVPASMQARSLLPLITQSESKTSQLNSRAGDAENQKTAQLGVYSETEYAHRTLGWSALSSWRSGKYLYLHAPRPELYDQTTDPKSAKNLASNSKAVADTLAAQLSDFQESTKLDQAESSRVNFSSAENLHALGYMSSTADTESRIEKPAVDPKDKVHVANSLQDAIAALEEKRYAYAIAEARMALRDPDAVNAYLEFGSNLVSHKRYQDALPLLRVAVNKLPKSASAHYELGIALINTAQWEAALREMRKAVAIQPDSSSLHFTLAAILIRLKNIPDASSECEQALKIDPNFFDANLTYGKLLLMQNRLNEALTMLGRAARIEPSSAEAHYFLAKVYARMDRTSDEKRERETVEELEKQPTMQPPRE
jgi:arylsulfatase A-like enzyme/Flp pilus assembly protein TadD